MVLGSPLPSWQQIFTRGRAREEKPYLETDNTFLLAESCMSIGMVVNAYRHINEKPRVSVWLPDYFCNQTLASFREDWMDIIFYPVTETLDPDWRETRAMAKAREMDVFLFVHYFGRFHPCVTDARELCKTYGALLIEDCAHVLYPTGKMGQAGDFVIFSPHKQLPIPDGAVLKGNTKDEALLSELRQEYSTFPEEKDNVVWYLKKAVQKLVSVHRRLTYFYGEHFDNETRETHPPRKISRSSYHLLSDYSYETLKRAAYIRRDNLSVMNYLIRRAVPEAEPLLDESTSAPYLAVYSLKNVTDPQGAAQSLLDAGYTVLHWPDLPPEVDKDSVAARLSREIVTIPIHQNIKPQKLIRRFGDKKKPVASGLTLVWNPDRAAWDKVFSQIEATNIPQEWVYGEAKQKTEGWRVRRAIIKQNDTEEIGLIQILEKRLFAFCVAVRVNRGPILLEKYNQPNYHFAALSTVKERYTGRPILVAPFVTFSPEHLELATQNGWNCSDCFGFPSALVDLNLTEGELYHRLLPFWRKHLNQSKKLLTIRYNEYDSEEIIRLYKGFLEMKQIPGIPEHILRELFSLDRPPLEILTAHNESGKMIAFKGLYVHGNTGTSFIAWNTDEGRDKNARTLLIWSSMLRLKEIGLRYFDLGGVDDITTEAVAHFKRGVGGEDYRLLGEFIKL